MALDRSAVAQALAKALASERASRDADAALLAREVIRLTGLSIPAVHVSGTSRDVLIEQLVTAMEALDGALAALQAACPNGRDYDPKGASAIHWALFRHVSRVQRLAEVRAELREIAESI